MNRRIVFNITGKLLRALSAIMLLPMLVSIIYREGEFLSFLIAAAISFFVGTVFMVLTKNCKKDLYAREGFLIVSLAWLSASLIG
ncbi:MAG: TrkH family potassium uptake protein, partial [Clostridia bacterium]|nr:TrkH family potassium uptake protein [Clostridia bacterium]